MRREAVRLPDNCPACGADGYSLTCIADIPHFKEVMIMAFDCEACGFKSSEVKRPSACAWRTSYCWFLCCCW